MMRTGHGEGERERERERERKEGRRPEESTWACTLQSTEVIKLHVRQLYPQARKRDKNEFAIFFSERHTTCGCQCTMYVLAFLRSKNDNNLPYIAKVVHEQSKTRLKIGLGCLVFNDVKRLSNVQSSLT